MKWYKQVLYLLEREFGERFMRCGYEPYIELSSNTITVSIDARLYESNNYFLLNYVHSNGTHKNVLNRIRDVLKNYSGFPRFSGIIYEDVISAKAYDKLKDLKCISVEEHTKENFSEDVQIYFDMYYGTFIEVF